MCICEFYVVVHVVPNCPTAVCAFGRSSLLYGRVRHKTAQDLRASSWVAPLAITLVVTSYLCIIFPIQQTLAWAQHVERRLVKKGELFMQICLRTLDCDSLPYRGYFFAGQNFCGTTIHCINNHETFSRVKFRGSKFLKFHLLTFTKRKVS